MTVCLRYGNTTIEIPESMARRASAIEPRAAVLDCSPAAVLDRFRAAVESPLSGASITEAARGAGSACIIVSDKTRSYGTDVWMPALLDILNGAGVPDSGITVLFATGAHGAQTPLERARIAGAEAAARVTLVDHGCDDEGALVELGRTERGTPVRVNRLAAEARLLITTGVVMPHYYAGFTGGRKSVVLGVAARETIFANHALNLAPGGGADASARTAVLAGNPIHEDFLDALRFVRVDFSIQVVPDGAGGAGAFFAGDIIGSHEAACALAGEWCCAPLERRAPWVIASCGGFPKDINFYQSHKSLDNAFRAVEPGGALALISECAQGIGPEGFAGWFDHEAAQIEARLREGYVVMGHTALRIIEKTKAARVFLLSELQDVDVARMGMTPVRDIGELEKIIDISAGEGLILPHAALTVPTPRV